MQVGQLPTGKVVDAVQLETNAEGVWIKLEYKQISDCVEEVS
jgi:hypothetical protein